MESTQVGLIKKLRKDLKMKLLVAYLAINLLYILIGSYIFFTGNIAKGFHYKEFSVGLKYLFITNCIVFFIIIILKMHQKKMKSIKKPIYLGILLCVIFGIISTIFAVNTNVALEGYWGRYEGLYSILYYLTLMLLSTFVSDKYKKVLVNTILVCGLTQVICAIFQSFNLFNVKRILHYREYWVTGFSYNPNVFGTNMLLCLSYSLGLLIDAKKTKICIIYSILAVLFMFGLLVSNTSSCIVGLAIVGIYVLVYTIKNKLFKKLIVVSTIIFSITCLTVLLGKTTLIKDMNKAGNEALEIAQGNLDDTFGTKRMYIWKETVKIIPKHLWHGVGIDNFYRAFNGGTLIYKVGTNGFFYDKAHNEYLQTLVTQGIFALASYLFIYGYTVHKGIKNSIKNKEIYLVLPIIGYLIQAFFNISVIEVAPIFYMALGLCCTGSTPIDEEANCQ